MLVHSLWVVVSPRRAKQRPTREVTCHPQCLIVAAHRRLHLKPVTIPAMMTINTQHADDTRENNFTFLRLLLATLVLVSHSFELIDGNRGRELLTSLFHTVSFGELAVDGFFL